MSGWPTVLEKAVKEGLQICQDPTEIQKEALNLINNETCQSKDVIISAPTGTGKTLAYLAPILAMLQNGAPKDRKQSPLVLILTPTRELAVQTSEVLEKLLSKLRPHWLVGGCLAGGAARESEKLRLRKGLHVIVATPGRLEDHLRNTEALRSGVKRVQMIVLDEVDRMVDAGFGPAVNRIVAACGRPPLILLSATTQNLLENCFIALRSEPLIIEENVRVPVALKQEYCVVPTKLRLTILISMLRESDTLAIVFVSCRDVVDYFALLLKCFCSSTVFALHGSLEASERTRILSEFKQSKSGVLICTDVVARGIDFSRIPLVIQFEPPGDRADYIHRIGRSARQGESGRSCLFLLEHELPYLEMLNLPITKRQVYSEDAFKTLDKISYILKGDKELREKAEKAYRSAIRAYATHVKDERGIFHPKKLHLGHYAGCFGINAAEDAQSNKKSKNNYNRENSSNSNQKKQITEAEKKSNRLSNSNKVAPTATATKAKRAVSEFDAY